MTLRISLVHQFDYYQEEALQVCFSPDGNELWSSDVTVIYQWKRNLSDTWEDGQCISDPKGLLLFSPDGNTRMIVNGDVDLTWHFYSLDGKEQMTLSYPDQTVTHYIFSPDQRWFVSGDSACHIVLWDRLTHQWSTLPYHFPMQGIKENHLRWLRGHGSHLTQKQQSEIELRLSTAESFQITPDGQRLAFVAASDEGYVHICHFDPLQKQLALQKTLPLVGYKSLKISPDGKVLAVSNIRQISLYDMASLRLLHQFSATPGKSYDLVTISPDSHYLMCSKSDGTIDIWSLVTFECEASFAAHPGLESRWSPTIGAFDWSCTGYIATSGASFFKNDIDKADYTIKIWKVENEIE